MSCFGGGGDEALKEQRRVNKAIDAQIKKEKDVYKGTHRLLLLGGLFMRQLCRQFCVFVLGWWAEGVKYYTKL